MNKDYYVYGLFEMDLCFYVGKGRGNRKTHHFRNFKNKNVAVNPLLYYKLHSLDNKNVKPTIKVFKDNLSENDALEYEKYLITKYKRKIDGGTLCNVCLGGNQPPTIQELIEMKGEEEVKKIKLKRMKSNHEAIFKRNQEKIEKFKTLMSENVMIKDIAKILNVSRNTLTQWSKRYNIPINYTPKSIRIKEHLNSYRDELNDSVQKTSKTYVIKNPDGSIITVQKLVRFCKENNLDYANLRKTYNGTSKHHKGYSIIDQKDPI